MNVVTFVIAVLAIFAQVVTHEPLSWGAALLVAALVFRFIWWLAKPNNSNM